MKEIFVDAVYGKLEDGMPQLNISVNYISTSKHYYLSCTPCQKTDTGMQFQFGLTHCSVDLEEVSRANKKIEEKWQLWAEDHKWGILKAFTEAGEACGATRKALRDYVDEWEGMKFDPSKAPNLNANDNKDDEEKSEYYPEYDLDLTPSEKAALDAGTKRFNFTTGELDDVEPEPQPEPTRENDVHFVAEVDTKELQKAIKDVASIVDAKACLDILYNIKVEATDKGLALSTKCSKEFNDITYTAYVPAVIDGHGSFYIDAKMAKAFKNKNAKTKIHAIDCDGQVDVTFGFSTMVSQFTEHFPKHQDIDMTDERAHSTEFTVTAEHDGISKCCANDSLRPQMNGILFDYETGFMVASNGHVLRTVVTAFTKDADCLSKVIVPTKAFDRMSGTVKFDFVDKLGANFFRAEWMDGKRVMTAKFIEGRYPNWSSVIPTTMPFRVKFADPNAVRDAMDSINAAMDCKKYPKPAHLRFEDGNDKAEINAEDLDYNIKSNHKVQLEDVIVGNMEIGIDVDLFRTTPFKDWDGYFHFIDPSRATVFTSNTKNNILLMMPKIIDAKEFDHEAQMEPKEFSVFNIKTTLGDKEALDELKKKLEEADIEINDKMTDEEIQEVEQGDPITEPSDAEEVIQKAEENEPRPANYIPPFPQHIMWANEDKQQPDMVAAIYQYKEVVQHISEKDATIYYVIQPNEGNVLVCLETAIYMPAVDKMVVFSFYTGKALSSPTCKMTANDKVNIYTWEEGMNAIDVLHQVNKDVAM